MHEDRACAIVGHLGQRNNWHTGLLGPAVSPARDCVSESHAESRLLRRTHDGCESCGSLTNADVSHEERRRYRFCGLMTDACTHTNCNDHKWFRNCCTCSSSGRSYAKYEFVVKLFWLCNFVVTLDSSKCSRLCHLVYGLAVTCIVLACTVVALVSAVTVLCVTNRGQ